MPLLLARDANDKKASARQPSSTRILEIGLLNNLSDAGLEGGDRQIIEILREAAGPHAVRLRCFSLPSIPRSPVAGAYIGARYADFSTLMSTPLDGLIVTGCEPRAKRLFDEIFWLQLAKVIDWAEHNTRSTIWSCLAAHAAVLHLDGIERRPLAKKCTGLFHVEQTGSHALLAGMPATSRIPHSRWNSLDADELEAAGYKIMTRGPQVDVDAFTKSWRSLFIYLQGHPEYDGDALRREYRRDVLRYLNGTSDTYPNLPTGYFCPETEARLLGFAACAKDRPDPKLALAFSLDAQKSPFKRDFAIALFRNWLDFLQVKAADHAA